MDQPFRPYKANALVVSASTTHDTSALNFPSDRSAICQVVVSTNPGDAAVWVLFGPTSSTAVTAGTNGVKIPGGGSATLTLAASDLYASSETASGTATVTFHTGEGF